MDSETLVRVEHLFRYYGDMCAVRDVGFEIRRGEVVGFLGPNGAGKTTTLRILSGNLAPSAGSVHIGGVDLLDEPRRAKALLGYLPEQPPVYPELSVDEYLVFCARLRRMPAADRDAAVEVVKHRCGLKDVGRRLIGNLSKGVRQRVGIAQAVIHSPPLVLLDEPTVGLDPIQVREIRALIRELAGNHGVVLSTHILPEVQAICDRVLIINKGELVFSESTAALNRETAAPSVQAAFSRAPTVAELAGLDGVQGAEMLAEGRFRVRFLPEATPAALVERSVACGWGLYELAPERPSLEQLFVDITCAEADVRAVEQRYRPEPE